MKKIASPQELQAELKSLMAYVQGYGPEGKPDRQVIASKLRALADRVAAKIDWPRKGQSAEIKGPGGAVAELKPAKSQGEFMLKFKDRTRWGTRSEIEEDIKQFQSTGTLPPKSSPW
jgi:hypothetical protein